MHHLRSSLISRPIPCFSVLKSCMRMSLEMRLIGYHPTATLFLVSTITIHSIKLTQLLHYSSSGLLRPMGATEVMFTPPSSLQFMVELSPEYSRRRLFNSFSNITYEWSHNDSILNGRTRGDASGVRLININGNTLAVPRIKSTNAGIYSSQIDSFGFANYANKMCVRLFFKP